jgi:photosystem II stability/assembly factor-like uncharacterized protein
MNKSALIFLFSFLILSCDNDPVNPEEIQFTGLDGWMITKSDYDFDINPRDIFFLNPEIGFVVGYRGDIFKTIDSGKSWKELNSGTTLHLHSVYFLDENVGFVSSQAMGGCLDADCDKGSTLLKTIDGGATWTKIFFSSYSRILSLRFFNALNGIALIKTPDIPNSRDAFIGLTTDGGITWNLLNLPVKPSYDKIFYAGDIVFVAGENQKIFKSKDQGRSWETISTPIEANNYIRNIYFFNENTGYIDGVTSLYKTTDGGARWTKVNFPFTNFGTVHFYNENEGFNVESVSAYEGGDFPTFKGSICYETIDGGESWSKSDLDKSLYLGLTFFPKRDLGYGFNLSEFCTIKKKE